MNDDEVRLALGKPLVVSESDEVQWKYGSSLYVFLKDNVVVSVLK